MGRVSYGTFSVALALPCLSNRWAHVASSRQAGPLSSLGCPKKERLLLADRSGDKLTVIPNRGDSEGCMLADGPLEETWTRE